MSQPTSLGLLCLSASFAVVLLFLRKVVNWIMRIRSFRKTMPAIPTLFPPESAYRQLWPKKWQTFHKDWHMQYQRSIYRKLDSDIFALVCLFEYDKVFVSDPAAVVDLKIVQPREFPRDMLVFKRFAVFGRNVVATIGEEWKRHRKITARTFSHRSMQLVHAETAKQTSRMIASWEKTGKGASLIVGSIQSETNKVALHVMAGAGYGYPLEWDGVGEIPEGHQMSFHDSIHGTLDNIITYVFVPRFLLNSIPLKCFRQTKRAFDEIGQYVLELVDIEKRIEGSKPDTGENILSNLVKHSVHIWEGPKEHALADDELIGNAYVFLLQDTRRPNALLYAFYMLAIHPEIQEKLYQEIQEICGNQLLSFTDIPNMTYCMCIMYEVMRIFPVIRNLPTRTEKDQILLGKHLIPKNTGVGIDLVSLHRNEKYWGNTCNEFDPSRFDNRIPHSDEAQKWQTLTDGKLRIPEKGAYFAFGEGPRACLSICAGGLLSNPHLIKL